MTPVDLRNLTPAQLEALCREAGLSAAQAARVFAALCSPQIPEPLAPAVVGAKVSARLAGAARSSRMEPAACEQSRDGTVKLLFRLEDGCAIESVLIPAAGRHTLCVSSQAGCAMGCRYCLTAALGFRRNLSPAEIVNQVLAAQRHLLRAGILRQTPRQLIDNLVFMGMGEPLANYDNLLVALATLMDERGFAFSERRVTVSTCGHVPGIRALGRDARVNLAVSLHTVDDAVRGSLMPVNAAWGVDVLLEACREYSRSGGRVVFFECVLIAGLNDREEHARRLAQKLAGITCRVNLLPYNESPGLPYRRPADAVVTAYRDILHAAGFRTLIRNSRGTDIGAACGQLAARAAGEAPQSG